MAQPASIEYQHIAKKFGETEVLRDVNLAVTAGSTTCIIGPSGSGKSTLLRCTNLLEAPTSGRIMFGDWALTGAEKKINTLRARMGMVFQNFCLYPHMSVIDNVTFALRKVRKMPKDQAHQLAVEQLTTVGLAHLRDRRPNQLSGGQQQRVAIARALAMEPDAMLFDEATSALDPELVKEVLAVIRELSNRGMTIVMVTHEMNFARDVSDQIAFLDGGSLVEVGRPDQVLTNPKSDRLAKFLGQML